MRRASRMPGSGGRTSSDWQGLVKLTHTRVSGRARGPGVGQAGRGVEDAGSRGQERTGKKMRQRTWDSSAAIRDSEVFGL